MHVADAREHVVADRDDQRGLFGEANELGRRNPAALGMVPAHQRLVARDVARHDLLDRLQAHFEITALERGAQLALEADLVECGARIVARPGRFEHGRCGFVTGQRRERGAITRELAHQERTHDRIGGGKALGELAAVDWRERAIGDRARGRGARRIVDARPSRRAACRARDGRGSSARRAARSTPRRRRARSGTRSSAGRSRRRSCCRRGISARW